VSAVGSAVCVTVDVEDFAEGMAVLGERVAPRAPARTGRRGGLGWLLERLEAQDKKPKVTLFVVGDHAPGVRAELQAFAAAGHEVASHGPDHGRLPEDDLVGWLRRGRTMLEDLIGAPVTGFRSPRFDVPAGRGLTGYRHDLAEAGFAYVSDTARLGPASPVAELPVLTWRGVRVGGGSYQRLLPLALVTTAVRRGEEPAVLYYHSYVFDGTVPGLRAARTPQLARQVLGRRRIAPMVWRITGRFGSRTCAQACA
jgi:hypothetical protein